MESQKELGRRQANSAWIKYNMREVLGGEGGASVFSAAPAEKIHKENQHLQEHAEWAEKEARRCGNLSWDSKELPPPDFAIVRDREDSASLVRAELCVFIKTGSMMVSDAAAPALANDAAPDAGGGGLAVFKEVRIVGPLRTSVEEATRDGYELKKEAFSSAHQGPELANVRQKARKLELTKWSAAALQEVDAASHERRLPELTLATQAEKFKEHEQSIKSFRDWIYEKKEDVVARYTPCGPSWAQAGQSVAVPKLPGVWYFHERQNEDGKHLSWLFFNASSGRYYRQLVAEGSSCGWVQTGAPHSPVEHPVSISHGSTCLPAAAGRKDVLAVALADLPRTSVLLKQALPFIDKPAALFFLVEGLRGTDAAAKFCAQRLHMQILPRLSARPSELEDYELASLLGDAVRTLDGQLLESSARYAGCGVGLALVIGRRLITASIGGVRVLLCRPPALGGAAAPRTALGGGAAPRVTAAAAAAWSCTALVGGAAGDPAEVQEAEQRRLKDARAPLDHRSRGLAAVSASNDELAAIDDALERVLTRVARAAHPFAALGLKAADLQAGAAVVKQAIEDFMHLTQVVAAPGARCFTLQSAKERIQWAARVVEVMLGIDVYGTQMLAELFYALDEDGGIPSPERAAALLGVEPGCCEATAQAAISRRYTSLLAQMMHVSNGRDEECISWGQRVLEEYAEAVTRTTTVWSPSRSGTPIRATRALGVRDFRTPRRLLGIDLSIRVEHLHPGNCSVALLSDSARHLPDKQVARALTVHAGRPRAAAMRLALDAERAAASAAAGVAAVGKAGCVETEKEALGVIVLHARVEAEEQASTSPANAGQPDAKRRKMGLGGNATPGGARPNKIRASQVLMRYQGLKEDSYARSKASPPRSQLDAERELTEMLEALSGLEPKQRGEKFKGFVLDRSDCKSATSGQHADLGWISPGQWGKEFDAVAFDLLVGGLSDVFITPRGAHVLYRLA